MSGRKRILDLYPQLERSIEKVRRDVFAHLPNTNTRTGYQFVKKPLQGVWINQYHMEPIDKAAKLVRMLGVVAGGACEKIENLPWWTFDNPL